MEEKNNYYSYMRVSTDSEKQNFNRQEKSLERYAKQNDIEYLLVFKEEKSAKNFTERKEFNKLERLLKPGDTVVFKDLSRFTREAENGYKKYMEWIDKGYNIVFIDNPTISSDYIKQMMNKSAELDLVTKTALESMIKLLLIVELDRVQKQREYIANSIKQGIESSKKKSGRKVGQLDKMTDELKSDIEKYKKDRSIKAVDIMRKHNISRNTLKKYVEMV